jgi:ATPase subunit of ABC transporter with duplicated ATPase domains
VRGKSGRPCSACGNDSKHGTCERARPFENVNVAFSAGRRYGLTGPNGAGKSTFMKILAGDEEQDTGDVSRPASWAF